MQLTLNHEFVAQLVELTKLEENRHCAECGALSPRWVSSTLGVFICMRCAGLHRSIGVHISRVKAISLDTWKKEQVDYMKSKGNKVAKAYFEAGLPPNFKRPTSDSQILDFIKRKYEQRCYVQSNVPYDQFTLSNSEPTPVDNIPQSRTNQPFIQKPSHPQNPAPVQQSSYKTDLEEIFGGSMQINQQTNLLPNDIFFSTPIQPTQTSNVQSIQSKKQPQVDIYDNLNSIFNEGYNQSSQMHPTISQPSNDMFSTQFSTSLTPPMNAPYQQHHVQPTQQSRPYDIFQTQQQYPTQNPIDPEFNDFQSAKPLLNHPFMPWDPQQMNQGNTSNAIQQTSLFPTTPTVPSPIINVFAKPIDPFESLGQFTKNSNNSNFNNRLF